MRSARIWISARGAASRDPGDSRRITLFWMASIAAGCGTMAPVREESASHWESVLVSREDRVNAQALQGRLATATGILKRYLVTQEDLDRQFEKFGRTPFAHRGPGTFYALVENVGSNRLAQAKAAP